jgi:urease accessory protein
MKARAELVAGRDAGGVTRLLCLRSEAPLILRDTPGGVYLVGGAAGPLGGDDLTLRIVVRRGASLVIRSSAASVALPGPAASTVRIAVVVEEGGRLDWLPEPTVAAGRCIHEVEVSILVEKGAALSWREEVLLGRYGEAPGSLRSRINVAYDSRPLLRHELRIGPGTPGWDGPAVAAGRKALGSVLVVDPSWAEHPVVAHAFAATAAVMPLAGPAALITALADGAACLRSLLEAGMESCLPAVP